ncbi:hypothetical protein [Legionella birminghamensis]|uniref:hypothetical protein n=1 Tax=Legionella birminghamensis TaxID=28083 RepID=UPI00104117C4|nr:hypothetical protein [Legionella birminghamensis]
MNQVIDLIPDEQTELDLSGEDLSSLAQGSYDLVVERLPANIKTIDLRQIGLHKLNLFNIQELCKLINMKRKNGKFEELKFTQEELQRFFSSTGWEARTKINHLHEAMADDKRIHVVSPSGTKIFNSPAQLVNFLEGLPPLTTKESMSEQEVVEHLRKLILDIEIKIHALKHARCRFFNFNKLHKAHMIQNALDKAIESDTQDFDRFVNDKHGDCGYSLRDALNYNRLWVHKDHTRTLRELHTANPAFNLIKG